MLVQFGGISPLIPLFCIDYLLFYSLPELVALPLHKNDIHNKINNGNPLYSGHDNLCYFYSIIVVTSPKKEHFIVVVGISPTKSSATHTFTL